MVSSACAALATRNASKKVLMALLYQNPGCHAAAAASRDAAREASRGSHTQPSESAMMTTAASRIPIESQWLAHTAGVSFGSERVADTGRAVVHESCIHFWLRPSAP